MCRRKCVPPEPGTAALKAFPCHFFRVCRTDLSIDCLNLCETTYAAPALSLHLSFLHESCGDYDHLLPQLAACHCLQKHHICFQGRSLCRFVAYSSYTRHRILNAGNKAACVLGSHLSVLNLERLTVFDTQELTVLLCQCICLCLMTQYNEHARSITSDCT